MSKKIKKVAKKVSSVFKPLGDITGTNAAKEQAKQAKLAAAEQERQAGIQAAQAAEQARGAAQGMETDAERQRLLSERDQQAAPEEAATIDLAPVTNDAANRRKKFQAPQTGGTGGGGASIRL